MFMQFKAEKKQKQTKKSIQPLVFKKSYQNVEVTYSLSEHRIQPKTF